MDELQKRLSNLKIHISENGDGNFTAYTTQEPLFCYVRGNTEELKTLVEDTLVDYVRTFYEIHDVKVETVQSPPKANIPVREVRNIQSWAPKWPENHELACV